MSKLFEIANAAIKRNARNKFAKETIGRLAHEVEKLKKGNTSAANVRKLIRELTRMENREAISILQQRARKNRSLSTAEADELRRFLSKLGPIGKVLKGILDGKAQTFDDRQIKAAIELIRAHGGEILTKPGQPGHSRGIEAAIKALEEAGIDQLGRPGPGRDDSERSPGVDRPRTKTKTKPKTPQESLEQEKYKVSRLYETPKSSNVFSFQYDYMTSTMYVRFKAPEINTKGVSNRTRKLGKMPGMRGKLGSTVVGKTDKLGPLYAYYDVPVRVFKRLVHASSAGGAVWDNLRTRGTVWGHKFRYALIGSPKIPGEDGNLAHYVPRRATRKGFRSRAMKGGGNRFVLSTLPEELDRGWVDRGEVDRGD